MIKANELRIGNWVYDEQSKSPVPIRGGGIMLIDEGKRNFEPIPLTPEILSKWRRDYLHNKFHWYDFNCFQLDPNFWVCVGASDSSEWFYCLGIILKYVHQLQNLFFDITGKELKIKSAEFA